MFTLAHVSDLHVSGFGDTLHDRARIVRRSARIADASETRFATCWEEASWRVLRDRHKKKDVILVDPEGYSHSIPSVRESGGLLDPVERAAAKACRLEARRARTLAAATPREGALASMLETTPHNANLRCLRAARVVAEHAVDAVVMTGDCTDDGDGWELIEGAFRSWHERGRLLVIPGNHDLYRFPIASSARPRPTEAGKAARWPACVSPSRRWSKRTTRAPNPLRGDPPRGRGKSVAPRGRDQKRGSGRTLDPRGPRPILDDRLSTWPSLRAIRGLFVPIRRWSSGGRRPVRWPRRTPGPALTPSSRPPRRLRERLAARRTHRPRPMPAERATRKPPRRSGAN